MYILCRNNRGERQMKAEIKNDRTILITPESIVEVYAMQFIKECHENVYAV
jgi:flagellar basal body-associated protein FliL